MSDAPNDPSNPETRPSAVDAVTIKTRANLVHEVARAIEARYSDKWPFLDGAWQGIVLAVLTCAEGKAEQCFPPAPNLTPGGHAAAVSTFQAMLRHVIEDGRTPAPSYINRH